MKLGDAELALRGVRLLQLAMIDPWSRTRCADSRTACVRSLSFRTSAHSSKLRCATCSYGREGAPAVIGKRNGETDPLFPLEGELTAEHHRPRVGESLD